MKTKIKKVVYSNLFYYFPKGHSYECYKGRIIYIPCYKTFLFWKYFRRDVFGYPIIAFEKKEEAEEYLKEMGW